MIGGGADKLWRWRAGGGGDGRVWEADAFFVGGQAAVLASMPLALSPELRSQRVFHARDVSCYDIPLAPGRFIVRLAFAFHSDQLPAGFGAEGGSAGPDSTSLWPEAAASHLSATSISRSTADNSAFPHRAASAEHPAPPSAGRGRGGEGGGEGDAHDEQTQRRWPRFAVVVEGVQMETVSMAQQVGVVYVPEYIVDSTDASLTLCFLPVWGHALVNTIEVLPVPASFYLLPPVVPPNSFLALRARIDCGRAMSQRPQQRFSSAGRAHEAAVRSRQAVQPAQVETNGAAQSSSNSTSWLLGSANRSDLAVASDGETLVDSLGRRWSSDLLRLVPADQKQDEDDGLEKKERSGIAPPKSVSVMSPIASADAAPLFLPQALLQTSREAVLASGLHYSFSFRIPARLNRWVVLLHFVALQPESRVGERVFDIHVNGVTVRGFDILREAKGLHNRLVTLPVVVGFSRPAIGSAPTLEVQLVARNGSQFSPLVSSIEVIEVVRANVPRENVVSELQVQQKTSGSQAAPSPSPSHPSHAGVVAGAIGGAGALVFLVLMVPLLLLWRHQHRRRHAVRSQLRDENAIDSAAVQMDDTGNWEAAPEIVAIDVGLPLSDHG
ncbi:hypothetical protein CLOP_g16408 [Closterium sp. NIES-67]|nr:hypothetical protein CLOP_g16408 [Closterium sp. NIES-67]